MAVAVLRKLFAEAGVTAEVRSAGTHAVLGEPAHPDACAVAEQAGLDLAGHRSQPLTAALVRWADVVLGMARGHVVRARDLDDAADVRLITEFDPAGRHAGGVVDPIGHDREVYDDVFSHISLCLEVFIENRDRPVVS
ncbi:hypothetical protein BH18GEM1_BH18GEM1_00230 [soil metagenome]